MKTPNANSHSEISKILPMNNRGVSLILMICVIFIITFIPCLSPASTYAIGRHPIAFPQFQDYDPFFFTPRPSLYHKSVS